MNIPNVRIESGLELRVRLKDNGVSLDWSSLQGVKALLYSVEQKAVAGAAEVAIDNENPQILIVKYPGSSPQYTGLAKLIVRCDYNGKQKTYDTAVANFVETTDEATGVIVLDDPTISVGISVEDVSTSLLDEAINAAFAAAEEAMSAAQQAKDEADKLPGIAADLQNAIDTAAATNSEIKSNESERLKSEQKRENSESARVAAERARASAEEARKAAEDSRINKENQRIAEFSNMKSTISDNLSLVNQSLDEILQSENDRVANEAERIAAEEQRKVNESERDMQEQTRQQQEQTRQHEFQSAEQSRQATFAASESARDTEFQSKESQRDAAMQTISQEAQKLSELDNKTLDFSVTEGQGIPTSTRISIQKSAGQYVAFELKSDVDISAFAVVYIKPTGGSSVTLKNGLRTNTKYYMQLPEDIVSLAVYAYEYSVKGSGDATFVVYGEVGSVDAKYGQETIKNNIVLESLIDKKTIGIVSFQNGSYLDKNGGLVVDNLGYYSDYIPVTPGDKFKYSGKNLYTTPCIYVILDMYKRVLSYNNNTGTFSDLEVEIEDASAAYIRFGSYELAPSAERVYLDSTKNYIDKKIADINSKLPVDVRPKHIYNLFDPSTAIIGKYVKPQDGTLDNSAPNVASDYMEVINGESYSFPVDKSFFGSSFAAKIAMYNASKTYIGVVTGTYSEKNANILTIVINNANCKYIRTTAVKQTSRDKAKWQTGYDTYMVINSDTYPTRYYPYGEIPQYLDGEFSVENNSLVNPLFGKSVIFDGDSICVANDDTNKYGWAGRIGTRNRMMWNNFAVGGGTFTKIAGRHVISETDYGNANPDYIIIEGGTNDADNIGSIIGGSIPEQYGSYLPTGYTDEFSTSTYCGAIEYLFKRLLSKYPKAKIGVIIAQKMGVSNDYTPTGNNRRAYFETLIKLCEKWGIPYINLWDRGRLNPRLSAYYTADNPDSFYVDGQHLTPNGYDVITPIIEEWMKTL